MITPQILEEVKNRLVAVYEPETIYLFGSYAWGHPDEESDLDLLVVINSSDEKSHKRTIPGRRALFDLGISKDLLVYTQEEFAARVNDPTSLPHKVKKDGKVIYALSPACQPPLVPSLEGFSDSRNLLASPKLRRV